MNERDFRKMAIDELWDLHQSIAVVLAAKLEIQKSELDKRLRRLHPTAAVTPKFRNPAQPDQTWSGRGKRPGWITELLNAGMNIRDFQISEVTASQI